MRFVKGEGKNRGASNSENDAASLPKKRGPSRPKKSKGGAKNGHEGARQRVAAQRRFPENQLKVKPR